MPATWLGEDLMRNDILPLIILAMLLSAGMAFQPAEQTGIDDALPSQNNDKEPAAVDAAQTARPETGTYIRDMRRDGYGLLVIYNNWTMDTVAVLTDRWDKPRIAVYLRTRDALEIDGIRDGEYGLYFTIGKGWNSSAGKFDDVYGYYHYNDPMIFETDDVGDEIEYTILELDLYEADATNFVPGQFQFPDISS